MASYFMDSHRRRTKQQITALCNTKVFPFVTEQTAAVSHSIATRTLAGRMKKKLNTKTVS